jgi:hypothetical protein
MKSTKNNKPPISHNYIVVLGLVFVIIVVVCVRLLNSSGGNINATPTGPATPSSGWHVDFADAFKAPFGTKKGDDNLWYPTQSWNSTPTNNVRGDNGNETEVYNSSQVSVSNGNLVLSAKYQNNVAPATGNGSGTDVNNSVQRNYVSGIVTSPTNLSGYKGFTWTPGDGSTWAFEIVAQWPVSTGGLWNAFWTSSQSSWLNERDFFEGYSNNYPPGNIDTDWIYQTPYTPYGSGVKLQNVYQSQLSFNPAAGMHRYTYLIYPDQSWSLYIDGALQTWVGNDGISPPQSGANVPMDLIINYALNATTFTSGNHQFLIKSVAVYQDNSHAGQGITGGGIAPGTKVK